MKLELDLSPEDAAKLEEAVEAHQDEGPAFAGWASESLCRVRNAVADAIERAREGDTHE